MLVGTDVILKSDYSGEFTPITHTDKLVMEVSEDDTDLVKVSTDLVGKSAVWIRLSELGRMIDQMGNQKRLYDNKKTEAVTNG